MAIVSKSAGNAAPVISSTSAAPGTGPSDAPVQALALRDGNVSIRQLVDLYMAVYSGRDVSRPQRLAWWSAKLGDIKLTALTDDHISSSA